ncbi:MAG: F0F1 ATP synthase subunit A [Kiritimatiellae bacterium]|nr:F0F1 ATP synthase subunit A [Kiritimatiellia bacterium]
MSKELVETATTAEQSEAVQNYVMGHVLDSQEWHLPFLHLHLPDFITLHGVMLIICAVFLCVLFGVFYRKGPGAPTGITNLLELFVVFIRDEVSIACLGKEDGRKMTPLFCTFFFFILGLNLLGLIPLFATATGNVNVTGGLAAIVLFLMILGGVYKNGFGGFIKAFIPHGVPWPILVIVTPLEFLGLFIKAFALMIRLFANMLAGHIVIFSLLGLIVTFGIYALPSLALALGISLMEIFIALLQAYIFTLLSAMFIGQVYHPAH